MDNMRLNEVNLLTHLLILMIQTNKYYLTLTYFDYDDLLQSSTFYKKRTQHTEFKLSKSACKFGYTILVIDKFSAKKCLLQVLCQVSWFSSDTDLSLISIHDVRISYDIHWSLCIKSWWFSNLTKQKLELQT